jgi:hypothetical protein
MHGLKKSAGSFGTSEVTTAWAAAATEATADAPAGATASYAYGVERRSIAFRASWIAI